VSERRVSMGDFTHESGSLDVISAEADEADSHN